MRLKLPPSWYSFMLILQTQENRERIARHEMKMQVSELSASRDTDSPPLLSSVIEDGAESGEGDGLDAMAVATHHRRRHGQGVEDGFFRSFDRRCDQWVHVRVGEVPMLKRRLFGIMWNDVGRGKSQHEVATAVARGGACARQSQRGTFRQSRELSPIQRSIGGDDNRPWFALTSTPIVYPPSASGNRRDEVPIPPLNP